MDPDEWAETEAQKLIEDAESHREWSLEQFYEALVAVQHQLKSRIDLASSDGVELPGRW